MSGEVSRSRQKKAGSSGGGGGKKGQQQPSNNQAAHRQYANKKKSKERQQQQKMNQKSASRFCCSAWTWILLLALTGVSMATYHQHPEKFQQVYDNLPPQVTSISHREPIKSLDFPANRVESGGGTNQRASMGKYRIETGY